MDVDDDDDDERTRAFAFGCAPRVPYKNGVIESQPAYTSSSCYSSSSFLVFAAAAAALLPLLFIPCPYILLFLFGRFIITIIIIALYYVWYKR